MGGYDNAQNSAVLADAETSSPWHSGTDVRLVQRERSSSLHPKEIHAARCENMSYKRQIFNFSLGLCPKEKESEIGSMDRVGASLVR